MPEQPSAEWTIERVELVLFNLEHKRWQIWQEHSPPAHNGDIDPQNRIGALFRRQVIRLLGGVREILAESIGSVPSNQFVMDRGPGSGSSGDINLAFSPPPPCAPDFWHLFLDYCDLTCNKYGITDEKVREFFRNPSFRQGDFSTTTSLTRDQAADLVSALPLSRDWDLFGCWHRCWAGNTLQFPPPGADKWHQPFYMARISQQTRSTYFETLRDTKVATICCDLDAPDPPVVFKEDAFFGDAYCGWPPEKTLAEQTYLAYAFLYDNIQNAMGFNATYIISFPIEVYDRTHFLQIQIVPRKPSAAEHSLQDLWNDWHSQQHKLFWTQQVKRYLEGGVERLSIAYFQSRWEEAIYGELKHNKLEVDKFADKKDPLPLLRKSLASTAHLLVPLEEAGEASTRKLLYRPYSWKNYYDWRQGQREHSPLPEGIGHLQFAKKDEPDLGAEWRSEKTRTKPHKSFVRPLDGLCFLPDYGRRASVDAPGAHVPDTIVNNRLVQLVDQHYHHMSFQLPQMIKHIDHQRQDAREVLAKYFSDASNRRKFNGTLGDGIAKTERIEASVLIEKTVFELMRLATGEEPVGWGFRNLERSLLQQPISEITSAFFSIGAAKTCTHSGRWNDSVRGKDTESRKSLLRDDLSHLIESIIPVRARCPAIDTWIGECTSWVESLQSFIATPRFKATNSDIAEDLIPQYKTLRWPVKEVQVYLASLSLLTIETGSFNRDINMYFPFHLILDLPALIKNASDNRCRDARLTWWDTCTYVQPFSTDRSFYKMTDIALKTRVILLQYVCQGTPADPSRIATAEILKTLTDSFARDFGRVFVFSNGRAAEVVVCGEERTILPCESDSVVKELLPPGGIPEISFPSSGNQKVALAFVWRVFEEH